MYQDYCLMPHLMFANYGNRENSTTYYMGKRHYNIGKFCTFYPIGKRVKINKNIYPDSNLGILKAKGVFNLSKMPELGITLRLPHFCLDDFCVKSLALNKPTY